jgi:hypothetical protein
MSEGTYPSQNGSFILRLCTGAVGSSTREIDDVAMSIGSRSGFGNVQRESISRTKSIIIKLYREHIEAGEVAPSAAVVPPEIDIFCPPETVICLFAA